MERLDLASKLAIAPGESVDLSASREGELFRPMFLRMTSEGGSLFAIHVSKILVGKSSQIPFASAAFYPVSLAAVVFDHKAKESCLAFETMASGILFSLVAKNVSKEPIYLTAWLEGHAATALDDGEVTCPS